MENGNGIDSCNKAEVNSEKKAETIVIMALEEGKPASDYGVADDKLKMCTVDNDNDSLPNQNAELLEAVTAEENVELKDSPIEKTTNEEVKQNGDVAESANNVLTIKVEPKPIETVEEKPLSPPPEKMSVEASEEKAKEAPVEEAKQEMIEEEMQDENDKKNLGDLEMEDQQSSTSSSPSALHIHLDEEDKDESLNGNDQMFWFVQLSLTLVTMSFFKNYLERICLYHSLFIQIATRQGQGNGRPFTTSDQQRGQSLVDRVIVVISDASATYAFPSFTVYTTSFAHTFGRIRK